MTDKNDLEDNARIEETQELLENIDDPVKLYLREITSTPLLSNEEEFRLALAVQADELAKNCSNELTGMNLQTILADIQHSWESIINDAHRLKHNPPDVIAILKEVRAFQDELLPGEPSYTRAFLDLP
ncbi:MAG TPA: sigma-70 factor domain-containing protein, partial [Anaerolineaceae bacterium]|nr:sigma-70 factor domain-containing protein [Anaerolineaceae bacterium]